VQLKLGTVRHLSGEAQAGRLLPAGAREKRGFVVYSGGRPPAANPAG
jgi:hypothetical protein